MMSKSLLVVLALVESSVVGCVGSGVSWNEYEALKIEKQSLKVKLELCEEELKCYTTTPEEYLSSFDYYAIRGNVHGADSVANRMKKFHPDSPVCKIMANKLVQLRSNQKNGASASENLINKLRKNRDDIEGITWYYSPYFKDTNNSNRISVYIGKSSSLCWGRVKISYAGSDWIFFDKVVLAYGDKRYNVVFDDKKSDNYTTVWEWIDVRLDDNLYEFLKGFAEASDAKIRLSGKYTSTRNISATEKKALKEMLVAYDILRNQ